MCGIAGHIWRTPDRPADVDRVESMCAALWHRGPDDGALWSQGPVALGHRRLSILDLSTAGRQPMSTGDGSCWIVFNGEIYNYLELREELEAAGMRFRTGTDTEVILQAYRRWGRECVRRFNGMWAFALYDTRHRTLFLSRDRLGIKPLYYVRTAEAFLFASEIKAILAVEPEQRIPHLPYLARFLPDGILDDGAETCFRNIRSLPPAHNAVLDLHRDTLTTRRYWEIPGNKASQSRPEVRIDELNALLQSAVRLHMRSDVPVGTCLSGGIDSSTIVGLMGQAGANPVYTFSGLYEDRACNEATYVDAVNNHVATVPCPVRPEPKGGLLDDLLTITWHQDEPTTAPGLYTQYHVMRRAMSEVTVVLDGQGGDELFAGYLPYFNTHLCDLMRRRPLRGRVQALPTLLAILRHWGVWTAVRSWDRFFGGGLSRMAAIRRRMAPRPALLHPDLQQAVAGEEMARDANAPFTGDLNNILHEHVTENGLPTLLHYEDRNSMAFSLEARVPLLDYRIVEFAFTLPEAMKLHGSWTKWILRKAAERHLPYRVAWRRSKMGYPTPMARWFRQKPDRNDIADVLFSRSLRDRRLVNPDAVERLWKEHQNGADRSWQLYRILTMELWFREFVEAWNPHPAVKPDVRPMQRLGLREAA